MTIEFTDEVFDILTSWTDDARTKAMARRAITTTVEAATPEAAIKLAPLSNRIIYELHATLGAAIGGIQCVDKQEDGDYLWRLRMAVGADRLMTLVYDKTKIFPYPRVYGDISQLKINEDDLRIYNGLDLEVELLMTLSRDVATDITKKAINRILESAKRFDGRGPIRKFRASSTPEEQTAARNALISKIVIAGSDIARCTRRGAGNRLICTREVLDILLPNMTDVQEVSKHWHPRVLYRAGKILSLDVFVCDLEDEDILIGYHGNNLFHNSVDVGYVYAIENIAILDDEGKLSRTDATQMDSEYFRVIQY